MISFNDVEDLNQLEPTIFHEVMLNEIGSFVYVKNNLGQYLYANKMTLELFNVTLKEIRGKTDEYFFKIDEQLVDQCMLSDRLVFESKKEVCSEERITMNSDGAERIFRSVKKPIFNKITGKIIGLVGVSTDITDLIKLKELLKTQAETDYQTQLFNRQKLWQVFSTEFQLAQQFLVPLICIVIDIDYFKQINDNYGHPKGDEVIFVLASILKKTVRKSDICGRIGGEEFLVILKDITYDEAFALSERVREKFNAYRFFEEQIQISISCGITEISYDDLEFEDMYRRADQALYRAKQNNKNQTWKG